MTNIRGHCFKWKKIHTLKAVLLFKCASLEYARTSDPPWASFLSNNSISIWCQYGLCPSQVAALSLGGKCKHRHMSQHYVLWNAYINDVWSNPQAYRESAASHHAGFKAVSDGRTDIQWLRLEGSHSDETRGKSRGEPMIQMLCHWEKAPASARTRWELQLSGASPVNSPLKVCLCRTPVNQFTPPLEVLTSSSWAGPYPWWRFCLLRREKPSPRHFNYLLTRELHWIDLFWSWGEAGTGLDPLSWS